ncbi:MAG: hypothetical protein ACXWC4_07570 [Telluria sp.]
MYLPRIILAIAITAGCSLASAQNGAQPSTKTQFQVQTQVQMAQAQASAAMEQMMPMFEKMMEAMINAQVRAAAKPEVADATAAFKRNLYDALRKKGFTAQEALQIMIATPLPAAQVNSK